MKFIYQLKDPDTRMNFRLGRVHSNYDAQLEKLFKAVCLIKDNHVEPALELIRSTDSDHIKQCMREELMDLCELIAVLWAQREEAGSLHDTEKAKALYAIFELLGGYDFFRHKDADLKSRQQDYKIFSYTYSKAPLPKRIVLYTRTRWGNDQSRLHPLPAILQAIFSSAGVECHVQYSNPKITEDLQFLKNCLILIDVQWCGLNESSEFAKKTRNLGNKVIGLFTDFHYLKTDAEYYSHLELFDIIWVPTHSAEQQDSLMKLANFTDFPVPVPLPSGLTCGQSIKGLKTTALPVFMGSIERNNLPRISFYISSVMSKKYDFEISSHMEDHLSAEDSYSQYLHRLNKYQTLLSFSLRYTGSRVATHRQSEAIALNKLLLQEFTPQLRRWYSPNEHFLEFTSAEELDDLCDAIQGNRIKADEVAGAGYQHYTKNYACDRLISHFSSML